jgi:hypothetical protein
MKCSSKFISSAGGGQREARLRRVERAAGIVSVATVWNRREAAADNKTSRE